MAYPGIIDDGNWRVPQQNGVKAASFPFFSVGDSATFIQPVPMTVDQRFWETPQLMAQRNFDGLGIGYLVGITDPQPIYGTNLITYDEIYASLPPTRVEYGTVVFKPELPISALQRAIFAFVDEFPCRMIYEYSLNNPLPILYRPQLFKVDFQQGDGANIVSVGAWNQVLNGQNVLAENTKIQIWMGKIYQRLSIRVDIPNLTVPPNLNPALTPP